MTGSFDEHGAPSFIWRIDGRDWNATIHTGFNDYLELPEALRSATAIGYLGPVWTVLAAGSESKKSCIWCE